MFDFLQAINPLYSVCGFLVGGLVGFTGVGGGSLMTPVLVLLFGIAPTTAVGTDLLYAAVTKANGTLVHGLNGTIEWKVTRRLAAGSVPATILTLALLAWIGRSDGQAVNGLVSSALGFALLLTAVAIFFHRAVLGYIARHTDGLTDGQTRAADHYPRRIPRRARIHFIRWRGRHRHDRAARALSAFADG